MKLSCTKIIKHHYKSVWTAWRLPQNKMPSYWRLALVMLPYLRHLKGCKLWLNEREIRYCSKGSSPRGSKMLLAACNEAHVAGGFATRSGTANSFRDILGI